MPDGRRPPNERGDSEGTPAVVPEALSIYGYGDFDGPDQSASFEPPARADRAGFGVRPIAPNSAIQSG
jgi:hypothetical protein